MNIPHTISDVDLDAYLTAPRVIEADVEAEITSEHFFTAAQGDMKAQEDAAFATGARDGAQARPVPEPLGLLTFCVLVLRNGFTVTGNSACVSPTNFEAEIGKREARADAVRQVWPLLGYALRDKVHHEAAVQAAVEALEIAAENCETNAPLWSACGNDEEAKFSSANAASCRAAIARLVP